MRNSNRPVLVLAAIAFAVSAAPARAQEPTASASPPVPRTWDDEALRELEVPLAFASASPRHVSAEYYYRMPVRPVYKSYPIYHPDHEPSGYLDDLSKRESEIVFDASVLETEEEWIRAGELVFEAPIDFVSEGALLSAVRSREWYEKLRIPLTRDGVFPFMRYVVRERGKVEVGTSACAMCHTRVMRDGTAIKGAQRNFPDDRSFAYETRLEAARAGNESGVLLEMRSFMRSSYAAPWLRPDPNSLPEQSSLEDILAALEAIPPGVCARQGSSAFYPPRIPDLIGVKERRYLDASGLVRHRSVGDLMRYSALNQGADLLSTYDGFRPVGELPAPEKGDRYSDEQLYALALFLYELEPPANPNPYDALAARGREIFDREGCALCHEPPLYTNNTLTPASGFQVPAAHEAKFDVMPISVGTDPDLTMRSRRGTGYYKVPSLKGLWYRGPFGHNGSVATLEAWFDPQRLKAEYVPTGFRGVGVKARAVPGHEFGLELTVEDRRALVAFLKTL
jgi:hypothetical protein